MGAAPLVGTTMPRDRLRIMRIIARMNVGGPAVQASLLTTSLDADRFESRLLVGSVEHGETEFTALRPTGVPLRRIPGLGRAPRPLDDARALRAIAAELRQFRPHIVHTHTAKAGALGRLAAVTSRVPARVHTFHGHLLHGYFSRSRTRAVIGVESLLAQWTSRLVAVGAGVRDDLLSSGVGQREQYVVIPPGVDLPEAPCSTEARRQLSLEPEGLIVAYVGRLTRVKRPDRFLETAFALAKTRPDVTFLVVGDGELRDHAETRARLLGPRIRFLGWRPDVENVYSAADVIVLTSDNEGMPYSLIEAALSGRPAVTTGVGSAAEVVVDGVTGFVTARSATALAYAVGRLLDDPPLRAQLGTAARERAQREFSAARLIHDTEALYERVAAESISPS